MGLDLRMSRTDLEQRFTSAVDANGADLLAYCERRLGADGADALAETLLAAWRNVKRMPEPPEETRMWLFAMANGAVMNARRSDRRRASLADRLRSIRQRDYADAPEAPVPPAEVLAGLNEEDTELLRLIHWEGFGVAEAGQIIGLAPATARSRYSRAKATLRTTLDPADVAP